MNMEDNRLSFTNVKNLKENMLEASNYMNSNARNEDIIICFGMTKSGKSTLINYYLGNELVGEAKVSKIILHKRDDNSYGPEIGSDICSTTKIPKKWTSESTNSSIWDSPGNEDNRGVSQDISNSFYMYQLFLNANSIKIVLIVDFNDILNDNVRQFCTLLTSIEKLLTDQLQNCFNNIGVIFTKTPTMLMGKSLDIAFVQEILKEKFLAINDDVAISQVSKEFARHLIENSQNIGLFRLPTEIGPVNPMEIDVNIFQAIQNITPIEKFILSSVKPSVSDKSLLFLRQAYEQLCSVEDLQELAVVINRVSSNLIGRANDNSKSFSKLKELDVKLCNMRIVLNRTLDLSLSCYDRILVAKKIDSSVAMFIKNRYLLDKYSLMQFMHTVLNIDEDNQFDIKIKTIFRNAKICIEELISFVNIALDGIQKSQQGLVIGSTGLLTAAITIAPLLLRFFLRR